MTRRLRRRLALLLVISTALGCLYLDYRLIPNNPKERRAQAELWLQRILGDFKPRFKELEISLTQVHFKDFSIHDPNRQEPLLRAESLDLEIGWPLLSQVRVRGLETRAELLSDDIDFAGVKPDPPEVPETPLQQTLRKTLARLPSDLRVSITDSRIELFDRSKNATYLLRIDEVQAQISDGLAIAAQGRAAADLLISETSAEFNEARSSPELPENQRLLPLVESLHFDLWRKRDGDIVAKIRAGRVWANTSLGDAVPRWIRDEVWNEIGPDGRLNATVDLSIKDGFTDTFVDIYPLGMSCTLRRFPYPITELDGHFFITRSPSSRRYMPESFPGDRTKALMVVGWENVNGRTRGGGRILARGAVYIGRENETVSIFSANDFFDFPIDGDVGAAIQASNEKAYKAFQEFSPQGLATGQIIIVKDMHGHSPGISVRVDDLGSKLNARYAEVPIPIKNFTGNFRLMEGGNVELDLGFKLAVGGQGTAKGFLNENNLIDLNIEASQVPITSEVLSALPPKVQKYVYPLSPSGGLVNAQLHISKPTRSSETLPQVDLRFESVRLVPDVASIPILINGRAKVQLDASDPSRKSPTVSVLIEDVRGQSEEDGQITGLRAEGDIFIDESRDLFVPKLFIKAESVQVSEKLISALPPEIGVALRPFEPRGMVKDLDLALEGLDQIRVKTIGSGLTARYENFPYQVWPEQISIEIQKRRVLVHKVTGRLPRTGRFQLSGELLQGLKDPSGGAGPPTVDLQVQARPLTIDSELAQACPQALRELFEKLAPSGQVGVELELELAPELGLKEPKITGQVQLDGLELDVLALLPEEERFTRERVRELRGRLVLQPELIELSSVSGRFLGAPVAASGQIARPEAGEAALEQAFVVRMDPLVLGPELLPHLPKQARGPFEDYQPRGPVSLELSLRKERGRDMVTRLALLPKGLAARPKVLGSELSELRGRIDIDEGAPKLIALTGLFEGHPFELRRSALEEAGGPPAGLRLKTRVRGFDFKAAALARLPAGLGKAIKALEPLGAVDLNTFVQLWPESSKKPPSFWIELGTSKLDISAGARLEAIKGAFQMSGSISDPARFRGGFELAELTVLAQPFQRVRGRLSFDGKKIVINEFDSQIHGGSIGGFVQTDTSTGQYEARFDLRDLSFANLVTGLSKLSESAEKSEDLPSAPVTGRVDGSTQLWGNPSDPRGKGELRIKNSNAIPVPIFFRLTDLLATSGTRVGSFDRITLSYELRGTRGSYDTVTILPGSVLQSRGLDLAVVGTLKLGGAESGQIDLRFLPLDPTDKIEGVNWLTNLVKRQIASIRATGTLTDPSLTWLPLRGVWEIFEDLKVMMSGESPR